MVNDAWRLAPWADVLYATDAKWWRASRPPADAFLGERWSSHNISDRVNDDKTKTGPEFGLKLIDGAPGDGFCFELGRIHYGDNSGFAAINLALQFGAEIVYLLGFDMGFTNKRHFFGDHPKEIHCNTDYSHYIGRFDQAARMLPAGVEIINCTPGSRLACFPRGEI